MAGVEFDYVVVGAGAAGSVVAGRLAMSRTPLLPVPKGFSYTLRGDRYLYRYVTQPVGRKHASEVWLRGRVVGGSAAVNGMMWMRGAAADWDGPAARGNPGWSRAGAHHNRGASATRGAGGPLGLAVTDPGPEVTRAILQAAVGYGWQHVADA